jgi:hypothetical protein
MDPWNAEILQATAEYVYALYAAYEGDAVRTHEQVASEDKAMVSVHV